MPLSLFEAIGSARKGSMPLNFTEKCALLSESRKLDAVAIFDMMVSVSSTGISSTERRKFTVSLKIFFDAGHEHIS